MTRLVSPKPASRTELLLLLLIAVLYTVPVVACWNLGYLDFGDGNYMYISWRLSQGAVLYRDILAPQPPLHLYLGAGLAWLGDYLLPHPIWAFRTFSLILHLGTMLLVWNTARWVHNAFQRRLPGIPVTAAAIYIVLPIGFWWTLGYQSQPLLIFLLLTVVNGVVRGSAKAAVGAGIAGGLALLTNMTTAPYVLFTAGWLLLRRTKHGFAFSGMALLMPLVVIPFMEWYTGAYISNVVQNQVGAFPRADVLAQSGQTVAGYIFEKLQTEGGDVLRLEGTWVAFGVVGMLICGLRRRMPAREYLLFFSFFSLCSIVYVAKGGTVDYVFSLAEPYVAIFAAVPVAMVSVFLMKIWQKLPRMKDLTPLIAPLLGSTLIIITLLPGLTFNILTLQQRTYEMNEAETLRIVNLIKQNSKPTDLIIAPPHLAFVAKRRLAQDFSEHFLWRLKYMNERLDGQEGRAVKTVEDLAAQIKRKELPILILDLNQTGTLPEVKAAVEKNYRPMLSSQVRSLNTPFMFYKPL